MEKKEFKAESKRLLDLMINSIYTHKEIFLRELISNASDATDKYYYNSLKNGQTGLDRNNLPIHIDVDKENRRLTIRDCGCGMTKEELESNLGTIAKSGSLDFKKTSDAKEDEIDIIGQFGVGFYAAFMVSSHVQVMSLAEGETQGWCWESDGADGYTITPCDKAERGTTIVLQLKENTEEENYDEFMEEFRLRGLIKKYSDYIRYPIRMMETRSRLKEGTENEYEDFTQEVTVNSMVPLWKKNKSQITKEEYNNFYREKFYDFEEPAKVIHTRTEGAATYQALLFIPSRAPHNYYTREYEKGLQLYASGVLIMEKCADLLPDHFSFVRGLVDSQDLSLNISREMLQHDRQLKVIASSLEKKIKSELETMLKSDRENYEKFFANFGLQLKFGIYDHMGIYKDQLKDLIMFRSSKEGKMVTLAEYVKGMEPEQQQIYYACGETAEKIDQLPQMEALKERGLEVLYLTDDVDEFALKMLDSYEGKQFKSITDGDLDLSTAEEKKQQQQQEEENKDLFAAIKEDLDGKVEAVRLSNALKSHPVCLSAEGEISLEMEKVFNAMPGNKQKVQAKKVLEINGQHPIFATLCRLQKEDPEKLATYSKILYHQARLLAGLDMEDPVEYANAVCSLMTEEK